MIKKPLSQRGIALIFVMSVTAILVIFMREIALVSRLHFITSQAASDDLIAYYSALSGYKLSSLFITLHGKIKNSPEIKQVLGREVHQLDLLWQLGFMHPLPIAVEEITMEEPSKLPGTVKVNNTDLSGRINLNWLGSDAEKQVQAAKFLLQSAYISEYERATKEGKNTAFFVKYEKQINTIIENIADWIDSDDQGPAGTAEAAAYKDLPYQSKNEKMDILDELHLIPGITDEIAEFFLPRVTVYGNDKININTAPAEIIRSLSPELRRTDRDYVGAILAKRPFGDVKDFNNFVVNELFLSPNFNKTPKIPLGTDSDIFEIRSQAQVGKSVKIITAVIDRSQKDKNEKPMIYYFYVN